MGKKVQKKGKQSNYDFVFTGNAHTYIKNQIVVSFKPIKKHKILPIFNHDRKPFTPAFFVPALYSLSDDERRETEFKLKINEISQDSQDMLVPKPKQKSFMCCRVCRKQYTDYAEHIDGAQHKYTILSSAFNKIILETCDNFRKNCIKETKQEEQSEDCITLEESKQKNPQLQISH